MYTCYFSKLIECGTDKLVSALTLDDRIVLVQSVTLHHVVREIEKFVNGLSSLSTKSYITKYPQLLKIFITIKGRQPLTAGMYF